MDTREATTAANFDHAISTGEGMNRRGSNLAYGHGATVGGKRKVRIASRRSYVVDNAKPDGLGELCLGAHWIFSLHFVEYAQNCM